MSEQTGKPAFAGEILLCEDGRMNQELISERLAKLGLKTTVAENGREGVETVKRRVQNGIKPFDLIFMDIHMPVMGGLEAAVEIGKLNTGTPVIAMTPNTAPAEREQYFAAGMPDCLNKPFTPGELLACLMKYLEPVSLNAADQKQDMQDDERIKIKLIHLFMKNNKNIYNEITKAVDNGDIKLAHRLAHTLKGNAGIFGKTRLQEASGDVESLLTNEENRLNDAVMGVFKTELDAVLREFEPIVAEKAATPEYGGVSGTAAGTEPVPFNGEKTQELLEELESLLDGGDTGCLQLIDSLRLISGCFGPSVHRPSATAKVQ
jgi:CheY-like chemotaxis protein